MAFGDPGDTGEGDPPPVGQQPSTPGGPPGPDPLAGIPPDLIAALYGDPNTITDKVGAAAYLKRFVEPWKNKDWRKLFEAFTQDQNPNVLLTGGARAVLERLGFKISPANAAGETTKIGLPDGTWVRVLTGAKDHYSYDWVVQGNEGGGGGFWNQTPAPDPYTTPERPDYLKGQFQPPTEQDLLNSPGYQARMDAAQRGFERSAASKGSLLSGGTQVALSREMQTQASGEYGNLFGQRLAGRSFDESAFQSDVGNKLNQYKQRYQAYQDAIANLYKYAQ